MLTAASRAFAQLFDPATLGVLLISVIGAGVMLLATWFGTASLLDHIHLFQPGWLDWLARAMVGIGTVFASLALFGGVAALIAGLLVGRVAASVERRYYPGLPPPRRQAIGESLRLGLSFLAVMIGLNALALPFYLIWGANLPIFLLLNGYLLGREYFELVAARRVDRPTLLRLRRAHGGRVLLAGVAIAALSALPLANLLAPIVATAFMLHLFYALPELREDLPRPAFR
jgi:CysZ protein